MYAADVRQLDTTDILAQLESKREQLYKQRLAWVTGALDNPNELKLIRRDIARILTILREREIAAEIVKGEGN